LARFIVRFCRKHGFPPVAKCGQELVNQEEVAGLRRKAYMLIRQPMLKQLFGNVFQSVRRPGVLYPGTIQATLLATTVGVSNTGMTLNTMRGIHARITIYLCGFACVIVSIQVG